MSSSTGLSYELQAKKWGTITMSSSTGLSYLGPIRATGKDVRDNHYVIYPPPLDSPTSYRQRSEMTMAILFHVTILRATRQRSEMTISILFHLTVLRATGKEVRDNHYVLLHWTVLRATRQRSKVTITISSSTGLSYELQAEKWGTIMTMSSTWSTVLFQLTKICFAIF